jgi:hypothetical protein
MAEKEVDFKLYRYDPSMAAAVIFIILFLVVSVLHLYQMIRTRTWIFIPFVIGGICKLPWNINMNSRRERLITSFALKQFKSSDTSAYVLILAFDTH